MYFSGESEKYDNFQLCQTTN